MCTLSVIISPGYACVLYIYIYMALVYFVYGFTYGVIIYCIIYALKSYACLSLSLSTKFTMLVCVCVILFDLIISISRHCVPE